MHFLHHAAGSFMPARYSIHGIMLEINWRNLFGSNGYFYFR